MELLTRIFRLKSFWKLGALKTFGFLSLILVMIDAIKSTCETNTEWLKLSYSSPTQTYIKYFANLPYQLCGKECKKLYDCNSFVVRSRTDCFLYSVNCSTASLQTTTGSDFVCYQQVRFYFRSCLYRSVKGI